MDRSPAGTMAGVNYETVIGLEIHVELETQSKMFCGCPVAFGGDPNTRTCPVCLGLPGSLPVCNEKAIEYTAKIGLALGSHIAEFTQFHRKNYFYPDMPKNYQISQYDLPICTGGYVDIEMEDYTRRIGITRVHLEEDTGKLIHMGTTGRIAGATSAQVDFNRAGTPLVEIVSEPDIRSPEEARAYVQKLRNILLHLGVSDCNMQEGSLRCDANVSIRPMGSTSLGTKVEVKNMNSFRAIHRALAYEVERQTKSLRVGGVIVQETRHWDADTNVTHPLRSKEEAHDYRYFPEPDLVPMTLGRDWVEGLRRNLPELPDSRRRRFVEDYGLSSYDAEVLTSSKASGDFFERVAQLTSDPKTAANWVMGDLVAHLKARGLDFEESPIPAEHLAALLGLIEKGTISGKIAKSVFEEMFDSGKGPQAIVEEKGLVQVSDEAELETLVDSIIQANPQAVEDFNAGNERAIAFLVGQIMKETKGRANPGIVNRLLRGKLAAATSK